MPNCASSKRNELFPRHMEHICINQKQWCLQLKIKVEWCSSGRKQESTSNKDCWKFLHNKLQHLAAHLLPRNETVAMRQGREERESTFPWDYETATMKIIIPSGTFLHSQMFCENNLWPHSNIYFQGRNTYLGNRSDKIIFDEKKDVSPANKKLLIPFHFK